MTEEELIALGLKDDGNLKVILKGSVEQRENEKFGVVSVVLITDKLQLVKNKLKELKRDKDAYSMVYSCPKDVDLTNLDHYPSIEISREDIL